jgi:2-hydroxychromene-2-carboxylate isomerase
MSEVHFHFDFISPYAYVAWFETLRVAKAAGRVVVPVPVLFAGLLRAHGTRGPAEVPAKRVYVFKDAYRKAHKAGLGPLVPPPSHPFNPLVALRAVGTEMDADARERLVSALYRATWGGGGGIEGESRVASIANDAGLDGDALVARASEQAAKDRLKSATEAAIARGVFGVPTSEVDGELFWGVDAVELLADHLRGEDPVPRDLLAKWADLPKTSQRRE